MKKLDEFFSGEYRRIIIKNGGSIVNNVLTVPIATGQEKDMHIQISSNAENASHTKLFEILLASRILITWLDKETVPCFYVSINGENQRKPCEIKIIA